MMVASSVFVCECMNEGSNQRMNGCISFQCFVHVFTLLVIRDSNHNHDSIPLRTNQMTDWIG